jgi:hypothetical protein
MRWAGHVARIGGEKELVYVIGGKAKGKEDQDGGGWIILR